MIIRLGVGSGIAMGVEVDTAFFNGNHAPEVCVQGTFAPDAKGVPDRKVFLTQLALIVVGRNSSEARMWPISETFMEVT